MWWAHYLKYYKAYIAKTTQSQARAPSLLFDKSLPFLDVGYDCLNTKPGSKEYEKTSWPKIFRSFGCAWDITFPSNIKYSYQNSQQMHNWTATVLSLSATTNSIFCTYCVHLLKNYVDVVKPLRIQKKVLSCKYFFHVSSINVIQWHCVSCKRG